MADINSHLSGIRIAVPESRQLDTLARLFDRRGALVMRVPLVSIHDAPDPVPVIAWIQRFISNTPDLFIILTGEGLRRLLALAAKHGLVDDFINALRCTRLLCRGPKPGRALREIGLKGDYQAIVPTTDGIILSLQDLALEKLSVAVQHYGKDPNRKLMDYLVSRKVRADEVAPYIYAEDSEESSVIALIQAMAEKQLDVIAFTSQPQYKRLQQVARKNAMGDLLQVGLLNCCVAAIGPVVLKQLQENGVRVDVIPEKTFFMKPLVTQISNYIAAKSSIDESELP